jgi:hypothetical protein
MRRDREINELGVGENVETQEVFWKNCVLVRPTGDRKQGHGIHIEARLKYGLSLE